MTIQWGGLKVGLRGVITEMATNESYNLTVESGKSMADSQNWKAKKQFYKHVIYRYGGELGKDQPNSRNNCFWEWRVKECYFFHQASYNWLF